MQGGKAKTKGKVKEAPPLDKGWEKWDFLIRYLWTQGKYIIHDMHVMNTDAVSYQPKTPEKCLETSEHNNKKKHLHAFINECRNFTPSVASVD